MADESGRVDYDDPAAEAAYYAAAAPIMAAAISSGAACLGGLRMKAEVIRWTAGGHVLLGPSPTTQERATFALVTLLLAAPVVCSTCGKREQV